MRPTSQVTAVLAMALVELSIGLGSRSAAAQESRRGEVGFDSSLAPADFGVEDENITIVSRSEFTPCATVEEIVYVCAGLNTLPNGAVITQVAFYVKDSEPDVDFLGSLVRISVDSASGGPPWVWQSIVSISTDGSPGQTVVFENVNVPILYRQDVNGDGASEVIAYDLQVALVPPLDIEVLMARVRWKRRVSPAPQAASFNDVPVNDPAFQFVEALVASRITAGCGGGNYCPDAPLTRRQMAVFLAKALGLHWPWNAQ